MTRKLWIFTGHRSHGVLLDPVIAEISSDKRFELNVEYVEPDRPDLVLGMFLQVLDERQPEVALVPCDREEMLMVALALFKKKVPFAHFHAGDYGWGSYDDVFRHMISLMATRHFCQSTQEAKVLQSLGIEEHRIRVVGSTAFDGVNIEKLEQPKLKEPYIMVLWHSNPYLYPKHDMMDIMQLRRYLTTTLSETPKTHIVAFPSQRVYQHKHINALHADLAKRYPTNYHFINKHIPHVEFLAYLKYASMFVSNSSSSIYEAPHLNTPVVNFGARNAHRHTPPLWTGASKRIADALLEENILHDRLIRLGRY